MLINNFSDPDYGVIEVDDASLQVPTRPLPEPYLAPTAGTTSWILTIASISFIFVLIFACSWRLLTPPKPNPRLTVVGTPDAHPGGTLEVHGTSFVPNGSVAFTVDNETIPVSNPLEQGNINNRMLDALTLVNTSDSADDPMITVKADGTFDAYLVLPTDLPATHNYIIQAMEQGNGSTQSTVTTSLQIASTMMQSAVPPPTQATIVTYLPKTTPTPTPTPYLTPTPSFCVTLYPATVSFTIIKGAGIAPATATISMVFCGSGTVVASASPGILVTPATLSFATVGTSQPVVIKPAAIIKPGSYSVTFASVNGGNPGVLSITVR